ncbi:MAG: ABC transporter permease [Ruminococcus sp.]|nr:ABC transporter permease [Ruminococcus sp.]
MNIAELFKNAVIDLLANKKRTFLTMLGIVVSINAAIIIHVAGDTLSNSLEKSITGSFGDDGMIVSVERDENAPSSSDKQPDSMEITNEIAEAFEQKFHDNVSIIYDISEAPADMTVDPEHTASLVLSGVNADAQLIYEKKIDFGRFITDKDCEAVKNVIVISQTAADLCFGDEEAVGQNVYVRDNNGISEQYTVVGVYHEDELPFGVRVAQFARPTLGFIPYTTFRQSYPNYGNKQFKQLFSLSNLADKKVFKEQTLSFFRSHIIEENGWKLDAFYMSDEVKSFTDIITLLTYVITIIAVLAMIIGGIGIMNVMLVSINERIREIGVKKAVGAGNSQIIAEFLTESVLLSASGAVIGVVTGLISALNIADIIVIICNVKRIQNVEVVFSVPYKIIFFAIIFSIITGVVFGIFPALKAGKMNVVDALRDE